MSSSALSREERERLLKAIEEDREFRYALMGLLGFREILDRITRLEERFAKLEERQQKLEELFVRLEDRIVILEKRFLELSERVARIEERLEKMDRTIAVIAHRFGILTEAGLREAMRYVVEEILGVARVEHWVHKDEEGIVYGYPAVVEIDVVIRDKEHILVEVKSRVSRSDVTELHNIGKLYERIHKVKPRLLIIGGFIDPAAYEAAAKLSVELRPLLEGGTRV